MLTGYRTVYKGGTGEIVEKKSRFIANVFHVESEEEALLTIERLRKKYWDARHNCYAYSVGIASPTERCSDDGEPAKTAGRPILDVIKGENLQNTLVVVTRYFGGTLLGTGGLVRAYQSSAKAGIEASVLIDRMPAKKLQFTTDYNGIGKLQYLAQTNDIPILNTDYSDKVICNLLCTPEKEGRLVKQMKEATSGKAVYEPVEELLYSLVGEEILLFFD